MVLRQPNFFNFRSDANGWIHVFRGETCVSSTRVWHIKLKFYRSKPQFSISILRKVSKNQGKTSIAIFPYGKYSLLNDILEFWNNLSPQYMLSGSTRHFLIHTRWGSNTPYRAVLDLLSIISEIVSLLWIIKNLLD